MLTGGATGSLTSAITLTDSAFVNFLVQPFIPGSQLTFIVSVTGNLESGQIPDRFSFSILDREGAEIPTLAGEEFDQLVAATIDSPDPTFETFAGDNIRTPLAGGNAILMPEPSVLAQMRGDLDGDNDVDLNDANVILKVLNTNATGAGDPRDLNGDGKLNALDSRVLVGLCTRARCATQ